MKKQIENAIYNLLHIWSLLVHICNWLPYNCTREMMEVELDVVVTKPFQISFLVSSKKVKKIFEEDVWINNNFPES